MSQYKLATPLGAEGDLKSYSCVICRQRKVKCDRRNPCSNCVKAEKPCDYVAPVRGKRKRTKPPKESLHAKLKRLQELLKSYGAKLEPSDEVDDSDSESTVSHPNDDEMVRSRSPSHSDPIFKSQESKPKLITKEGTSRYFDITPWATIGDEFQHPEVGEPTDEANFHESGIFFESEPSYAFDNIASLHPSLPTLEKMKEIFVDRVDPLMKILHIPTFWTVLTDVPRNPQGHRPRSLEALIFSFYFVVITSLTDKEAREIFGIEKSVLHSRYRLATRRALVNAGFLSTSSPMTLQAYAIFMMSARKCYRHDTLFVLSGVAIRLARKMGLHRDGSLLGLSPFETEMRRRLWWHLIHVDFRLAEILGTRPSLDIISTDIKMPLNVDDEDLNPNMTQEPTERNGITPITFCLVRCEIFKALERFVPASANGAHWEVLRGTDLSFSEKDRIINQIEEYLETKYLRYCDPLDSLHTFISIMVRSSIGKMRVFCHSPRSSLNRPIKIPQSERSIVFSNCMKLLEYLTAMHGGLNNMEKYMWQIGTSYLWGTMLFVLVETRNRKKGPEVDRAWRLIGEVYSYYPLMFEESTSPVFAALGKWTLQVWNECAAAVKAEGRPEPAMPDYIERIRRCREVSSDSRTKHKGPEVIFEPITPNSFDYTGEQPQGSDGNFGNFESFESCDFPDLLTLQMPSDDWIQWDQIIAEQTGFP
ncbi:putative C6 transcription factor [Daldinia caldariorum]|uniref:putative C6 transcription factor n=1 Tax=Daldinia caldariorum TaxID=326644 RepID=UPI00200868FE|nr:putative C6 transcription factor [Daldinia caldariorum]KAI1468562.1 putative C6 transcription factor [Daldinia caldariorum]